MIGLARTSSNQSNSLSIKFRPYAFAPRGRHKHIGRLRTRATHATPPRTPRDRHKHRRTMSTAIFNSAAAPKSYEFKVVLLGDRGVGKTCLVLRFIEGLYNARQQSTIGAFFLTKKIKTSRGDDCKIQIWDTAGQERFRAMAPMYYRNAAAAVVCFDGTDQRTFQTMRTWVEELRANVDDKKLVIAIAITKSDLDENRQETRRKAEEFASSINDALVLETSAKNDVGVRELFATVAERVIELRGEELLAASDRQRGLSLKTERAPAREPEPSNGCC